MILKIRNSIIGRVFSVFMIWVLFFTMIAPINVYALTGGAAQPEFNSFTPIGTSDMVDLASGDFSYNIPIMDVGGFPINLAYKSGISMDQEASWVGLGWDLSIGQINRQMRGLPDDFNGDQMQYENNIKNNYTVGTSFNITPAVFGLEPPGSTEPEDSLVPGNITFGVSAQYNSYTGMSMTPSLGMSFGIAGNATGGLNLQSDENGLNISPTVSLTNKSKKTAKKDRSVTSSVGVPFNSRQGLSQLNLSVSTKAKLPKEQSNSMNKGVSSGSIGSNIGFVNNTYTPALQTSMTNLNFTFNAALGSEIMGPEVQGQIRAFGSTQFIPDNEKNVSRGAFGYNNNHLAGNSSVRDFNREKDGIVTVNTSNLPLTNFTYDIYSVQGQGVGGMFRPYHSQVGYVHDNKVVNLGGGISAGGEFGGGNAFHLGFDGEVTETHTQSGNWVNNNQALDNFENTVTTDPRHESIYFKNVGDLSVDKELELFGNNTSGLGQYAPIRISIDGGSEFDRSTEKKFEIKNIPLSNTVDMLPTYNRTERVNRNQNVLIIKNKDIDYVDEQGTTRRLLGFSDNTYKDSKPHLTAGFIVTRNDGARYIYGEPLYNKTKREVTFAVGDEVGGGAFSTNGQQGDCANGLVDYIPGVNNSLDNQNGDHYFNRVTTPAYAHTFLLTCLLSTDYSDISGDGPTEDDFGSYTLFTYRNTGDYKWRVPFQQNKANYSEGLKTDPTDDKGSYVYGEKETKYIQKIETKTHVAIFYLSPREDGHGVIDENGGYSSDSKMYKLDKIELYSKGEYAETGVDAYGNIQVSANSIPIKTAHFEYSYKLCDGIHNNINGNADMGGKLTLEKVYFTYRNSFMGEHSAYVFHYGDKNHDGTPEANLNPNYNLKGYDVWGNYKPNNGSTDCVDPVSPLSAPEFNYIDQDDANIDDYASAWSITDIDLPSGGKIKVDYESDDYGYVQDNRAMEMFKLVGVGSDEDPSNQSYFSPVGTDLVNQTVDEGLLFGDGITNDPKFLYFKMPDEYQGGLMPDSEFYDRFLKDIVAYQKSLVQFRIFTNLDTKGGNDNANWKDGSFEYVNGYFKLALSNGYGVFEHGGVYYASIPMKLVNMEGGITGGTPVSPLAKATWQFGRKYLSKYIYSTLPNDGVGSNTPAAAAVDAVLGSVNNLIEVFAGANGLLRTYNIGKRIIPEKSWIRLVNPDGNKKGGGCRVKKIAMVDNWDDMTSNVSIGQEYGQEYDYTLENGKSSGVATYEPVGAKDNPFVQPVFSSEEKLLAPDDENYVEKPFGESFFPSPQVTYSRVTVKNLERIDNQNQIQVKKHATGKVTTEFYTSKDYPTITDQTRIKVYEDGGGMGAEALQSLLDILVVKHITLSQGYVVHLNDMNGKMKSQRVFAEGQDSPISGVDYNYDGFANQVVNTSSLNLNNQGSINNLVKVLKPNGDLEDSQLGVEYDVINDFQEMKSNTTVKGVNANLATFLAGIFPAIVPVPLPKVAFHETKLNMVTTTKVINTFGVLRETVAYDAGASVSTRNLLWDESTGEVLLTETVNEYGDKYYSLNFPAHWYYKGMGMAAENSGLTVASHNSGNGYFTVANADDYFYPGDELLMKESGVKEMVWVKYVTPSYVRLIDKNGDFYTGTASDPSLKVIRSGRRNIQSTSMASVVLMKNPLDIIAASGNHMPASFLNTSLWNQYKIVNAGAVEFSENWDLDCECGIDNTNEDYNPYVMNTKGIWRASRSYLYLTGRHHNTSSPDPRNDGFYNEFNPFYFVDAGGNWHKNTTNWTFTSEVTNFSSYGFELENKDALNRYSSAQYGYSFMFPMAVSANARYSQMGFDGFEDYSFLGCDENEHFGFRDAVINNQGVIDGTKSHTGKYSLRVNAGAEATRTYHIDCSTPAQP